MANTDPNPHPDLAALTLSLTRTHHVVVAAVDLLYEGAGKALDTVTARLIRGDRIEDWI